MMSPLHQLIQDLDSQSDWDDPPRWVQVFPDEMVDDHNMERLIGFVAPDNCTAVALVAGGWAWSMDRPVAEAKAERQRIRTTCAVSRLGQVAGRIRWADGLEINEAPSTGRALDSLLRCFQLPTAPPTASTGEYFAVQWLDAVCAAALRSQGKLTWRQAVALHPTMRALADAGHRIDADHIVPVARAGVKVWTWEEMRLQAIAKPQWLGGNVPPNAAVWMDEGMLSRWLLGIFDSLDDLLGELGRLVPDGVARRIRRTLRALEVLPASRASA
jgi:hypothetical protein